MRRLFLLVTGVVFCLLSPSASSAEPLPGQQSFFPQASAKQGGCEAYYTLQPFDPSILKLLGIPAGPVSQTLFTNPTFLQLRDWDFPSKVTSWQERPSAEEIARRREELIAGPSHGADGKDKSKSASLPGSGWTWKRYSLETFSSRDWSELEKWFAREGSKKVAGLCVDRAKAGYILAVWVISGGNADKSLESASAQIQYNQSVVSPDSSVGPNSATATVGGSERPAQELSSMSNSSRPGTHTCVYLFRANAEGGARREAPDYYYCHASDDVPRAAITTMLKYLAKTNPK